MSRPPTSSTAIRSSSAKFPRSWPTRSAPSSAKTASPACISRRISSAIIPIPPSPRRRSASSRATTTAPRVSRPTTTKSSPAPPARSSPPRATTAPRCSIHMKSITTPPTAAASSPPSTRPSRPTSRRTCRTPSISTTSKTARSASSWTSTRARSRPWPRSAPTTPTTIWRSTTTRPPFCSKTNGRRPSPCPRPPQPMRPRSRPTSRTSRRPVWRSGATAACPTAMSLARPSSSSRWPPRSIPAPSR